MGSEIGSQFTIDGLLARQPAPAGQIELVTDTFSRLMLAVIDFLLLITGGIPKNQIEMLPPDQALTVFRENCKLTCLCMVVILGVTGLWVFAHYHHWNHLLEWVKSNQPPNMRGGFILGIVLANLAAGSYSFAIKRVRPIKNESIINITPLVVILTFMFVDIVIYASAFSVFGLKGPNGAVYDFMNSLYFSFITWTTTGFGDYVPLHATTKIFATLEALNGYFGFAMILTSLSWAAGEPSEEIGPEQRRWLAVAIWEREKKWALFRRIKAAVRKILNRIHKN